MKNKKSNSLASELMEDLLEEDLSQVTLDESEAEGINKNRGRTKVKTKVKVKTKTKVESKAKGIKKLPARKYKKKS